MYCHVKYLCDGEKAIVPESFIKDFDENIRNNVFDVNTRYEVFWSPNPEDTPATLQRKQGKILTIDKEKESKQNKHHAPLPGYYFANILKVADSEKKLEAILDSKCGRKRMNNKIDNKDVSQKKHKDKKVTEVVKEGKKRTTDMLFNRGSNVPTVFEDSDSDDSIIPTKIHKEMIYELEKSNKILKTKNRSLISENLSLKAKFDEVYNLNIDLQKQLLRPTKTPIFESSLLLSENTSIAPSTTAASSNSTSSLSLISPNMNEISETIAEVPQSLPAIEVMEDIKENLFCLDEDHLSRVTLRVRPGQAGDSMFVKNLSSAVFSDEILLISSVTGTKCNAKKDSVARPALCPKRLDYIKKLFHERMDKEVPQCPVEERNKRANKINAIIAEKIITLGRKK